MNQKESRERGMEKSIWKTPKSEMSRAAYGSLLMSAQTVGGLCPSRRCVRKADHDGACWPKEVTR